MYYNAGVVAACKFKNRRIGSRNRERNILWSREENRETFYNICPAIHIRNVQDRVARWFVFKPKNIIWGKFWSAFEW
jgi:hypothetical protein